MIFELLFPYKTMAILTRDQLSAKFQNGVVPSENDFRDLIDSLLNKCDDDFFGRWKPMVNYYPGDVVIFKNSLYKLKSENESQDTGKQTSSKAKLKKNEDDCASDENDGNKGDPYCSSICPDEDTAHWVNLTFDLEDDDWEYNIANTLVAKDVNARVGIGTKNPNGKLHVEEPSSGRLIFNPHEVHTQAHGSDVANTDPTLHMAWEPFEGCESSHLNVRQEQGVTQLETTAECGFYLHRIIEDGQPTEQLAAFRPDGAGIGTHEPEARLDVVVKNVGRMQVNPEKCDVITLRLVDEQSAATATETVEENFNTFATDTKQGFKFQPTGDVENKNGGPRMVVIDQAGHLGVGTESPECELDVINPEAGQIVASVGKTNPALSIVNLRPVGKTSYLTAGADNSFAVFKTDAECGFVFKQGAEYDPTREKTPEKDLTGDHHVYIDQRGKVGVGTAPTEYETDVKGKVRANEIYLPTNETTIEEKGEIQDALDVVCSLTPILFKWRQKDEVLSDRTQFGLRVSECDDYVPQVVNDLGRGDMAIAYQNLVPLLIKAIQEQQELIDELRSGK